MEASDKTCLHQKECFSLFPLLLHFLVPKHHLAELLSDVPKLVIVLAGELGDRRLRQVAELPVAASAWCEGLELDCWGVAWLGDLIVLLAREVRNKLFGQVPKLSPSAANER